MSLPVFRFIGAVTSLTAEERHKLCDRSTSLDASVHTGTAAIIRRVQQDGDVALREMALQYDGVELVAFEVPRADLNRAYDTLAPTLRAAMLRSVANVRTAHSAFRPQAAEVETEPGVFVGRRPDPLRRVGVYAPGGRAAYPSSLIMGVVPAKVAGVTEIIVCSPPTATGLPSDVILAAAAIAGADRVFSVGGAGAIAAMAYGTESVPRVDRIVGPGNAWVAEAKLQCTGIVGIDSPAGPSELLVIADETSTPRVIAREMLAQAEHDPRAAVVCVAIGDHVATRIAAEVRSLLATAERADIISASLSFAGGLLHVETLPEAIAFGNAWAAEHLLLAIAPDALDQTLALVRNAGTIFVGESASVAFGDYMTGANHVLPTGGLARHYSGLSTSDFVRWTSWQRVTPRAAASLAGPVSTFAMSEGLPNHAAAARQWSGPS